MDDNFIFGPNAKLPSIEGFPATCEEELRVLMKEIDRIVQWRPRELSFEVERLNAENAAKDKEIQNLKVLLKSKKQFNKPDFEERIKLLLQEVEKVKHENTSLKETLQDNSVIVNEQNRQLEVLKNNLTIQKDENIYLMDKLKNLNQQHNILQDSYKVLMNLLSGESKMDDGIERTQNERTASNSMEAFILQEKEKYLQEEQAHCDELMSKINSEIEEFRNSLTSETRSKYM